MTQLRDKLQDILDGHEDCNSKYDGTVGGCSVVNDINNMLAKHDDMVAALSVSAAIDGFVDAIKKNSSAEIKDGNPIVEGTTFQF